MTSDDMLPILTRALGDTDQTLTVPKLSALSDALTVRLIERFPGLRTQKPKAPKTTEPAQRGIGSALLANGDGR